MKRNIVIYQDEGVGEFGLSCLQTFFKDDFVRLANAAAVIDNAIFSGTDIFVMPGGADLPYCKKLNGTGNKNIRAFVEDGGTYLGICAGAYYACASIEYHKGRSDEICEARELAFVDAIAIGSLPDLAPYYDTTLQSAAIAPVTLRDGRQISVLYHGGNTFALNEDAKILARYTLKNGPPAILRKKTGKGSVILSGVHFECSAEDMKTRPTDTVEEKFMAEKLSTALTGPDFNWKNYLLTAEDALT